jgi:hypothetical protein
MRIVQSVVLSGLLAVALGVSAQAQENVAGDPIAQSFQLNDGASGSLNRIPLTTSELRLARALEKQRNRQARIEANAWAGIDPARPTTAANPFSQSPYRIYRPTHIWTIWDLSTLH